MDPIKFLSRQHRRVESLFSRYERSPSKAKDLFGLIERALIPHAMLEEMFVYPVLRERAPNGERLAEEAIREHAEVEQTLKRMGSMNPVSSEFERAMRKLIDAVAHHVREEEESSGLFDLLRTALTRRELEDLGRTLRDAENMTPTRAHPAAPDRPPANLLLGLPTAAMDRLRDRISGRTEMAEKDEPGVRRRRRPRSRRAPTRKRGASSASRTPAARTRGGAASRSGAKRGASRRRAAGASKARTRRQSSRTKARRR